MGESPQGMFSSLNPTPGGTRQAPEEGTSLGLQEQGQGPMFERASW